MILRLGTLLVALISLCIMLFTPPNEVIQSDIPSTMEEVQNDDATPSATEIPTQSENTPTTLPETEPETTVPETTAPVTVPPTTGPTQRPTPTNPVVAAFEAERMKTWTCPLKVPFGEVVGSRTFASSRGGGKRAHAGLDFVAPHGTKVYAITDGTVQRVAVFFENTWAVEVKNTDGTILRYCEIATTLKVGDKLSQGDLVGTILRAEKSKTEMLHMEVYFGNGEGMLTQSGNKTYTYVDSSKNFMRRSDLMDPTFLKDLKVG